MTHRLVVGFDGSSAAMTPMTWAAGEARLRGAELVAVTALDRPGSRRPADPAVVQPTGVSSEESAGRYPVAVRKVFGDAAGALVAACADADLLVVGSPGRWKGWCWVRSAGRAWRMRQAPWSWYAHNLSKRRPIGG